MKSLSRARFAKQRLIELLFPAETDTWLTILRIGLAAQLIVFCFSIRSDWRYLLASSGGLNSRALAERILSLESILIPRLGWLVSLGARIGLSEERVLALIWVALVVASLLLLIGFASRSCAATTWLLHLGTVKSGTLVAYGVDNFVTIGLFYLMLSPLPDRFALDWRLRKRQLQDRHLLGFWRRVLQTHLCLIYLFGGIAKSIGAGWWDGTNLWRALIRPPFNVVPADVLIHFKYFFPIAGIAICVVETCYPFLVWNRQLRRPWLLAILFMHVGIGLAMGMYLFASVMIILNLAAFGPGVLWPEERVSNSASPGVVA